MKFCKFLGNVITVDPKNDKRMMKEGHLPSLQEPVPVEAMNKLVSFESGSTRTK